MNNKAIALIFTIITINLGFLPTIAQAQQQNKKTVSNAQIAAMVEALRLAAPKSKKPNPGYHTEWQIKPETLKGWSKNCLKKELPVSQFENDPTLTRQVVSCIISRELNNQFVANNNNENAAVRGAACWWMTGNYTGCNKGFTGNYVQQVVRFYQREIAKPTKKAN